MAYWGVWMPADSPLPEGSSGVTVDGAPCYRYVDCVRGAARIVYVSYYFLVSLIKCLRDEAL